MRALFNWLEETFAPPLCSSDSFIYDDMASQSGRSLPIIYQPFDAGRKEHWRDRGAALDFILSTNGEGKRLLDFGPGDGWPSLIVAPLAGEVVGVDASSRRVEVCAANSRRLGIDNAHFVHVPAGAPLPFDDASFDAAVAASSVEQSPDPRQTLAELYRVLRLGGRLRLSYEALAGYRGGQEQDIWLMEVNERECRLILFDRQIEAERVKQYSVTFALSAPALAAHFTGKDGVELQAGHVTLPRIQAVGEKISEARQCVTRHPSGQTLVGWLAEIGFSQARPTHNGQWTAGYLFDRAPRPPGLTNVAAIDAYLRPFVQMAVEMAAPIETDPMITATR